MFLLQSLLLLFANSTLEKLKLSGKCFTNQRKQQWMLCAHCCLIIDHTTSPTEEGTSLLHVRFLDLQNLGSCDRFSLSSAATVTPNKLTEMSTSSPASHDADITNDSTTNSNENNLATPVANRSASVVSKLVQQCRDASSLKRIESHIPDYPNDDFVAFTECRNGDFHILSDLQNNNGDDSAFSCPPTLAEMVTIADRVRNSRLKQMSYVHGRRNANRTIDESSSIAGTEIVEDDGYEDTQPILGKRTRNDGYKRFCLDTSDDEE